MNPSDAAPPKQCKCPGCGQLAVPGLSSCEYCDDAMFHFGHCPHCHAVLFRLVSACPKCGADLGALFPGTRPA
jgi:hypothetical protein